MMTQGLHENEELQTLFSRGFYVGEQQHLAYKKQLSAAIAGRVSSDLKNNGNFKDLYKSLPEDRLDRLCSSLSSACLDILPFPLLGLDISGSKEPRTDPVCIAACAVLIENYFRICFDYHGRGYYWLSSADITAVIKEFKGMCTRLTDSKRLADGTTDVTIADLGLDVRSYNSLARYFSGKQRFVHEVPALELAEMDISELGGRFGVGPKTFDRIRTRLVSCGFRPKW